MANSLWVWRPFFGTKANATFLAAISPRDKLRYILPYPASGKLEVRNNVATFRGAVQFAASAVGTSFSLDKDRPVRLARKITLLLCRPLVDRFELTMGSNENFLSLVVEVSRFDHFLEL
jgi:hypothetical protein